MLFPHSRPSKAVGPHKHFTASPLHLVTRYFNKIPVVALACIFSAFIFESAAQCEPFRPRIESSQNALIINGRTAVDATGRGGVSRARNAAAVLRATAARSVETIKLSHRKWLVETSNGETVYLVTRSDSRAEGVTVEGLARQWAAAIDTALAAAPITISTIDRPVVIPTGEFRSLVIGGAALPSQVSVSDVTSTVTSSSFNATARTVSVLGLRPGFASVAITAHDGRGGSAVEYLPVLVEDKAGTIDSDVDATVTGTPAAADVLVQAVRTALFRSVALHSGAYLEMIKDAAPTVDLPAGSSVALPITVRAAGSDLIPVEQVVSVHVVNDSSFVPETAQALFYSNNPETVKGPQNLFDAFLPTVNRPVRIVFHHQNVSVDPLILRVELINLGSSQASVKIIRGLAAANPDPVDAGAQAGTQFLREWLNDSGEVVTIPSQSRLELFAMKTQPGDVASGIFELAQTNGMERTLLLHVDSESLDASYITGLDSIVKSTDPSKAALALLPLSSSYHSSVASVSSSDQIYGSPSIVVNASYAVGGPWMHLIIGTDNPLSRLSGNGSALSGNYGVVYTANIILSNPTQTKRLITVSFASNAGVSSGVFVVAGGPLTTVNDLSPSNEQEIARVPLAPGASQNLQVLTVPLSGSSYPAAIVAHAL